MSQSQPLFLVQMRLDALEEEVLLLLSDLKILKHKYHTQNQQQNEETQDQESIATRNDDAYSERNNVNVTEDSHSLWYRKQLSHIQNLERQLQQREKNSITIQKHTSEPNTLNLNHLHDSEDDKSEDTHLQLLELHCRELCHWLTGEKHIIELMSQLGEVRYQRLQLEKRLAELEVEMLKQGSKCPQDVSLELTDKLRTYKEENSELSRDLTVEREQSNMLRHQVLKLASELSDLRQQYDRLEQEKENLVQQVAAEKHKTEEAVTAGNRQEVLLNDQGNLIRKLQQQVAHLEGKIKKREKELCFITGKGSADDMIKCEALLQAAWAGSVKKTTLQLESGADVHCRNYVAQTPLHLAAGNGHTSLCAMLLNHGAVVDPRDLWQNTPLHFAACNDHVDTVKLLLDRGAKSHAHNRDGRTPRDWAVLCKHTKLAQLFDKNENMDENSNKVSYDKEIIVNENLEEKSVNKDTEVVASVQE